MVTPAKVTTANQFDRRSTVETTITKTKGRSSKMGIYRVALLLAVTTAIGGCTSGAGGLFGGSGQSDAPQNSAGGAGGGVSQSELANIDPNSPEYFTDVIGTKIYFEVDQSEISAASALVLDQQARWLINNPGFGALIEGHADERGTREYNLALGARRASAARDYLVANGIAKDRLRVVTYGKERPEDVCAWETCWSRNRRSVTHSFNRLRHLIFALRLAPSVGAGMSLGLS